MNLLFAITLLLGSFSVTGLQIEQNTDFGIVAVESADEYAALQGVWELKLSDGILRVTVQKTYMTIEKGRNVVAQGNFTLINGTYIGFGSCRAVKSPSEYNRLFNVTPLTFEDGAFVWNGKRFRKIR